MRAEDCCVGMRVYAPSHFFGIGSFKGQQGKVVYLSGKTVGVNWDNDVLSFSGIIGHDCHGYAQDGHGWTGDVSEIEPEFKAICPNKIDISDIKIRFDDVFGAKEIKHEG